MIDELLRKLAKSGDTYDWPLEEALRPTKDDSSELPTESRLLSPSWPNAIFSPGGPNSPDYYKRMVQAAIENGGECAGHYIPVPWLKMILAGLEFRRIEPEALWEGVEARGPADAGFYYALFPSESEAHSRPR
jgi:hypothetical protein